jgi:hypothetical protein
MFVQLEMSKCEMDEHRAHYKIYDAGVINRQAEPLKEHCEKEK